MKKNILILAVGLSLSFCLTSCDDYLDIKPKGATLLDKYNDLRLLAVGSYSGSGWMYDDMAMVTNDCYGRTNSFMTVFSQQNTLPYAYMTYDESLDRVALTQSDNVYSRNYSAICALNEVVLQTPSVDATEVQKSELIAQAKVKRAYFHYLLAIRFCKQYDSATAANEGGIPYVTDIVVAEENTKLTLQETYDKMLEDCSDEVLASLPDEPYNILLPGKAFGYAVRAKVLLQMKNYSEAMKYAKQSLSYNNTVEDLTGVVNAPTSFARDQFSPSNVFYAEGLTNGPGTYFISKEMEALFEDGDIQKDYAIVSQTASKTTYVFNPEDIVGLDFKVLRYSAISGFRYNSGGVTSEQMHYIAAECCIRTGDISGGMDLINKVRRGRIDPAKYAPLTASTEKDAMALLMRCKRVECLFTYNTFADMKRWNTEEAYRTTVTRTLNGQTYTLQPYSPLWVFPFPKDATEYNKSLTQNY